YGVGIDEFSGFHTGVPLVAVVGRVYRDGSSLSATWDNLAQGTVGTNIKRHLLSPVAVAREPSTLGLIRNYPSSTDEI
ncbi:hypothetical protein, partial [Escherichia coli]|uniref:hypothetical protein n=1 Tax=Escherichia coli TaxID=562 RepID=UPI002283DEE1